MKNDNMEIAEISNEVKDEDFFFAGNAFILITPDGQRNKLVVFDDKITDMAMEYANTKVPLPVIKEILDKNADKEKYTRSSWSNYHLHIFNLKLWEILEANENKVVFIKDKTIIENIIQ